MTLEVHRTPEEVMQALEPLRQFGLGQELEEDAIFSLALESGENASNRRLVDRAPRL